jgi:O-antigen/teichoic acid export membrane protein
LTGAWNAFFYWPIVATVLPKSDVGYLGSVLSIASIFAPILTLSLTLYVTRELADISARAAVFEFSIVIRWYLLLAFLICCLGNLFFGWSVVFMAMFAQATLIWSMALFRGLFQPIRYFVVVTLCFGVLPTITILGIGKSDLGVNEVVLFQSVLIFATSLVIAGKVSRPRFTVATVHLKRGLKSTVFGTFALVGTVVLLQAGKPLIIYLSGPEAAAEFQFASAIGVGLLTAVIVLADAVLPNYFALDQESWLTKMNGASRAVARWILPATAILMAISYELTKFITPDGYPVDQIAIVSSIIVLAACPLALGTLSSSALVFQRRGNALAAPTILACMVGALLCFVLEQEVTIRVAFSMVVAFGIRTIFLSYSSEKCNGSLNVVNRQLASIAICLSAALFALLRFG